VLGRLLGAGTGRRPDPRVLVQDLLSRYLEAAELEHSTRESYAGYVRRTILPALGSTEMRKVRGPMLDTLYARLRRCGDPSCLSGRAFIRHSFSQTSQLQRAAGSTAGSGSPMCSGKRSGPARWLLVRSFRRSGRWRAPHG